jgi:hypothetical protein
MSNSVPALSSRIIRHYADGERGPVLVNEAQRAEMSKKDPMTPSSVVFTLRKSRRVRQAR